jgi:hypothetical protein
MASAWAAAKSAKIADRVGEVALVRDADQLGLGTERAHDLGGGRQERDDADRGHRAHHAGNRRGNAG